MHYAEVTGPYLQGISVPILDETVKFLFILEKEGALLMFRDGLAFLLIATVHLMLVEYSLEFFICDSHIGTEVAESELLEIKLLPFQLTPNFVDLLDDEVGWFAHLTTVHHLKPRAIHDDLVFEPTLDVF